MAKLSVRDNSILKALFDPESSPSGAVQTDAELRSLPHMAKITFEKARLDERSILVKLDRDSPSQELVQKAIRDLTTLIVDQPQYPSAYSNRAQATRLLFKPDDLFTKSCSAETQGILRDLGTAIELASPTSLHQPISTYQRDLLATAHTHRGFLLLKATDMLKKGDRVEGFESSLQAIDADRLEELASKDFYAGGTYGNELARQMSVKTNPYAKMCGAIVKEAMIKEMNEGRSAIYQ